MPIADGESMYLLVRPERPDGRNALLMHGWMSNPYHLEGLAREMAAEGITVGVAEYGEPIKGEPYDLPSEYKHRRACMAIEDMLSLGAADEWIFAAHSFGGVALTRLLEDGPVQPSEVDFICALGFGEAVKVIHPERLPDAVMIYGSELFSAFLHGRNIFNRHALMAQSATLLHRDIRIAELKEIAALRTGYAVKAALSASRSGASVSVIVAERDHVVKPRGTIESLANNLGTVVLGKANHFVPITHPRRVAGAMNLGQSACA